jgi:hypothetical protein
MSNLNGTGYLYSESMEEVYAPTGAGWAVLGCSECDWVTKLPDDATEMVTIDD